MSEKKRIFQTLGVLLALSVVLNGVLLFREASTYQIAPESSPAPEQSVLSKLSQEGVVYRDANDVVHVSGKLTTAVGKQVMLSIKEGMKAIEFDLVGGELSQAIRISELLKSYSYPISVKRCNGACLAIWLPSSGSSPGPSWEGVKKHDAEMTDSEWALLKSYLASRGQRLG